MIYQDVIMPPVIKGNGTAEPPTAAGDE